MIATVLDGLFWVFFWGCLDVECEAFAMSEEDFWRIVLAVFVGLWLFASSVLLLGGVVYSIWEGLQ